MGATRRIVLTMLPKWLLSRTTGLLTRIPLPRFGRRALFSLFSKRYGVQPGEMVGNFEDYRSLAAFFQRPLRAAARPIDPVADYIWPCDGKIVTSGRITGDRVPQVKGRDYSLAQLLQDAELADGLRSGFQATVYLAPGNYHRVHSPFDFTLDKATHIPGKFFPVNPGAVDSIPELFPRNERVVFRGKLAGSDLVCAVVMVSALNVADTKVVAQPGVVRRGDEIGWFGFGSTVVLLVQGEAPRIAEYERETVVRMGAAVD